MKALKLKLIKSDMTLFLMCLKDVQNVSFTTVYESKLSHSILKQFVLELMTKCMKDQPEYKISFTVQQLLVLDYILPQIHIPSTEVYTDMLLRDIHSKINQACLNI